MLNDGDGGEDQGGCRDHVWGRLRVEGEGGDVVAIVLVL